VVLDDGSEAAVVGVQNFPMYQVEVLGSREGRSVTVYSMKPLIPQAQDKVIVLGGLNTGQRGEYTAEDKGVILVKLEHTAAMALISQKLLAKLDV
jgi:hypothetical protein